MADIATIKQAHELGLMQIPGVEGVGIGADEIGNPAIVVYVSNSAVQVPREIAGFKVKVEDLKGPISALPASR